MKTDIEWIEKQPKGSIWRFPKEEDLFDHLELRTKDCLITIPPSKHFSGNSYKWSNDMPEVPPTFVQSSVIDAALRRLSRLQSTAEKQTSQEGAWSDFTQLLVTGVQQGGRNEATAKLAGHFKGKGLKKEEAAELIQLWNLKKQSSSFTK